MLFHVAFPSLRLRVLCDGRLLMHFLIYFVYCLSVIPFQMCFSGTKISHNSHFEASHAVWKETCELPQQQLK